MKSGKQTLSVFFSSARYCILEPFHYLLFLVTQGESPSGMHVFIVFVYSDVEPHANLNSSFIKYLVGVCTDLVAICCLSSPPPFVGFVLFCFFSFDHECLVQPHTYFKKFRSCVVSFDCRTNAVLYLKVCYLKVIH